MKIPTILSALLATSLAITAHTAPTTPSTDDSALFANLVKYDYKAADALVAHYNNAVHGSSSTIRSNAVGAKAAASKDILPFCVAIASNPTRTRVYRNKQSCDSKGWTTLFVFTAHTKKDKHHAAYPVCIGSAKNPDRSLIQTMQANCGGNGWKHESTLYYSGKIMSDTNPVSVTHESTTIWQASKPDRMMFYPYYAGDKHGWGTARDLGYRTRWRLATTREMNLLKADLSKHEAVNKKIKIVSSPDVATHRCVQNLIQVVPAKRVDTSKPTVLQGKSFQKYVDWAARDECSHLVSSSSIQLARTTIAKTGFTSIELVVKNKVYAAVSLRGNVDTPEYYIHLALQESLRTGQSIPVSVDNKQSDQIVALVAGTVATFGGKQTFNSAIPKK
ncbi:hypothetical protein BG015_011335 [Linnemannia schmuckeri]|uniref:Uncharacterized protein n=1 Tax=Linnemannia schmuckeri TaxID=64567 RepID=A0A9P5S4P1_9FUNG|nr:hypothetical protein BG015_011335 [Linnemannia schmuckeri]